ncbi:MAG TPA: SDR family oxidoreductase [Burkholderiales bacterium]|jgi:gluconate 5-dehydrogenase|nr:SDR family oxidoreductase [Burkholderiales bacterium]
MSIKQLIDLSGRVALITGGSRGLGMQMAEALGEMGAKLAITARKADELEEARAHLQQLGYPVLTVAADIGKPESIAPTVEAVMQAHGQIDILINNAGATWGAAAEDHPLEAWNKLVNVNMTGTFLLCQAVGRASMIPRKKGRIVNIASVAGLGANPLQMEGTLAYNTTKGGVVNFTRALAAEWGKYNITVNAICPGFFPSKMTRATLANHEKYFIESTPLRKLGGDEDLKGAALLFASDAGGHITGQCLAVDGGAIVV